MALVVAATLDQATYAGTLIEVAYEADPPVVFDLRTAQEDAVEPPQRMWPLSSSVGDADKAIAGAVVKIEQTYTMPDRHHNPMEPHATLAVWDEAGTLTLYDSTQMVVGTRKLASLVLGIPEEKINVVCEFLGGGFGGKSWSWPHTLLAALAAKVVNQPVRLQLTRAQMYAMVGHQAATVQTIALGAGRDGKLTGIRHDSVNPTSVFDDYVEYAAMASRHLWRASGGRLSCRGRPWRRKAISPWRAPWTNSRTRPASIPSSFACATTLTPIRTAAGSSPRALSANA